MELENLNRYLSKLEGLAIVEEVHVTSDELLGTLRIKFNGDVGTIDEGEIEMEFFGVEAMSISFSLIAPIQITQVNDQITKRFDSNYVEEGCSLFELVDDVGFKWWVYAQGYNVNVLPVFYGQ